MSSHVCPLDHSCRFYGPQAAQGNSHVQPSLGGLLGNRVYEPQGAVCRGVGGVPCQKGSVTRCGTVPSAKSSACNIASAARCSSPNAPATSAVLPVAVFPSSIQWGVSPGYASTPHHRTHVPPKRFRLSDNSIRVGSRGSVQQRCCVGSAPQKRSFVRRTTQERHTPRSSRGLGTPWPPCCRMWV
jgi:hypothetical protein